MLERYVGRKARLSPWGGLLFGMVTVALAGIADYLSGPYMWWDFVYVLPIALLAWLSSLPVAQLISLLAGATTTFANLHWDVPNRHAFVPYWNGAVTAITCSAVSAAICKLRDLLHENEFVNRVVSHDLMNILTAMRMNADYLLTQTEPGDTRRQIAENLSVATTRMRRIVGDLSIVSQTDGKALEIHVAPVDAVQLVAESVAFVKAGAVAKNIGVVAIVPPRPVEILADGERLAEVLDNLLGNAIKFTPQGGTIEISLADRPAELELHVRDTGPGIAPNERASVFNRYYKGRLGQGGIGLGLHIAKVIVVKHGGKIWVAEGQEGADFGIRLPRYGEKVVPPPN